MDPYLESPDIWPDFHFRLASEISARLNQTLPSPFYARLEMRPEIGIAEDGHSMYIVRDVVVAHPRTPSAQQQATAVVDSPRTEISKSIDVTVYREFVRHHFVEIRDSSRGHKLITLIEILSPSNKRRGVDRENYESKQREILDSDANLIEIDLLRSGERVHGNLNLGDIVGRLEPRPDFLVIVNRAALRLESGLGCHLFPIGLRDGLPCIPVPLRKDNADVPLDLQFVFNQAYDRGPYRRGAVDYSGAPSPPLRDSDIDCARELLRHPI
jgi:hypothetical protein